MRKGTNDLNFFGKRDYLGKMFLTNLRKVPSLHGPKH
jgi:hypothetical protein